MWMLLSTGQRWQQQYLTVAEVPEVKVAAETAVAESPPAVGSSALPNLFVGIRYKLASYLEHEPFTGSAFDLQSCFCM